MNRSGEMMFAGALLALALGPSTALAQAPNAVGVVTTLAGEATVARAALPEPVPVKFRDPVFTRDRITTGEKSIVRVLLGGKALVTARELSVLTINEAPLRSTVNLDAGKVGASVIKARMQPGEIIEFRTPNAVAVVRGTVLVVEVTHGAVPAEGGNPPITTTVSVLNGLVDVFSLSSPGAAPVRVGGQETVRVTEDRLGVRRSLTSHEAEALTADLEVAPGQQPQTRELPGTLRRSIGASEQAKAAAVAGLLAPDVKGSGKSAGKPLHAKVDKALDIVDNTLLEATLPVLLGGVQNVRKSTDGIVGATTDAVGGVLGGVNGTAGSAVGGAAGAVGAATGAVGGAVGGVGGAVGGVGGAVGGVGGAVGGVGGAVGGVGGAVGGLGGAVGGVGGAVGGVGGAVGGLGGAVGGVTGGLGGILRR